MIKFQSVFMAIVVITVSTMFFSCANNSNESAPVTASSSSFMVGDWYSDDSTTVWFLRFKADGTVDTIVRSTGVVSSTGKWSYDGTNVKFGPTGNLYNFPVDATNATFVFEGGWGTFKKQ